MNPADASGGLGGVYIAVVKDNTPDGQGRIAIALDGVSASAGAYPARVAAAMAGDGRGVQFLPEVGDQVLVAFINGSPNDAVVLGALWSSVDQPPEANANGHNDVKLIKTRSGHCIRLVDEQGQEAIEISDSAGNAIRITTHDKSITIDAVKQLTLTADAVSIVARNGDLVLKGGPKVKINEP